MPHGNSNEASENAFEISITDMEFLGNFWRTELIGASLGDLPLTTNFSINAVRRMDLKIGSSLTIELPPESLRVFSAQGQT